MPDLKNELIKTRDRLKMTRTRVTRVNGSVIEEQRTENGDFDVIFEDDSSTITDGRNGKETTVNGFKPSKRMLKRCGFVVDFAPDLQVAEVAEGIYLSSQDVAMDLDLVQRHGITHIVNAATGVRCFFPDRIAYLELSVLDLPNENLKKHFPTVQQFMRKALEQNGKVLVHCNAGISRSSTLVLAYIMRFERKPLGDSLARVRLHRPVARPNEGFMAQLREYEQELGLRK